MSLTKDDFQQIEKIVSKTVQRTFEEQFSKAFSKSFVEAFETYIVPYVDAKIAELERKLTGHIDQLEERIDRLEDRVGQVEENLIGIKNTLDEGFLTLHDKIDENTVLIGYYFEQCATKEQINDHERRLKSLEIPA